MSSPGLRSSRRAALSNWIKISQAGDGIMAFDWFRRRYTDSTDSSGEAEPSPPAPAPATEPAEISPEDYLAFAKAAYANLKARAAAQAPPATQDSVPPAPAEGIPAESVQPQPPASTEDSGPLAQAEPREPVQSSTPTQEPASPESPPVQPAAAPRFSIWLPVLLSVSKPCKPAPWMSPNPSR